MSQLAELELMFVTVCPFCDQTVCADSYVGHARSWSEPVLWSYLAQVEHQLAAHPKELI